MKLSVIIPNYNNGNYIGKCIDSIINQTYKNFEIIVIDDGSTDNSIKVLKEYKDKRITIIEQYNQNAAIARNRGLEIAKGEYVFFLDSDDEIYDNTTFERIVKDIGDNDLLIGNYKIINENSYIIDEYLYNDDLQIDIDSKYKYSIISPVPSNKLYKNSIIKKNKLFFDNVKIGQDLDFYIKYLSVVERIKTVDYYIYKYRILSNSMSRIKNLNFMDIFFTFSYIKKYFESIHKSSDYNMYISLVEMYHYNCHVNRLKQLKNRKTKKMIYNYLFYCISNIDFKNCVKNRLYYKLKHKLFIKRIIYLFI